MAIRKTNITTWVAKQRAISSADNGLIPRAQDSFYRSLGSQCLARLSGMVFSLTDIKNKQKVSVKAEQLPQFLASLKFDPYQLTGCLYRLLQLTRQLTPEEDNAIHLTTDKLYQMAKDPLLEADISTLERKVASSKNWALLDQKPAIASLPPEAPELRHNPGFPVQEQIAATLPQPQDSQKRLEVIDLPRFLLNCGVACEIPPSLVIDGWKERSLLKGDGKNEKPVRKA
ncbi:hypothetical protein A2230_07750 [candidate division WOR-1 bacterium RIFOXYA2_FULL_36_21]|uniref:Uncharacterized protein n=1 Tax=candidate division WOR-1 bacterium RIFOXYB2_FULL_36_35 TaxID=1802578 RepID=A0A1F4RYY0_UNCSA|nr:MAG: hypothetical protein A2230_07750 [candidate division WOR-1 bacterium RIFOXYA2_FULL_36_21]OGC13380.1 MAG: hypothetical protein A2290_02630 [candidate division WOR-1 bacterium RIFOXYB2_FULL_36_35]OGC21242.1 MAG: hypothetical protein A2282_01810 [candidate division WOR-1 bacterium RIFOXYA12_FULL_36_13]